MSKNNSSKQNNDNSTGYTYVAFITTRSGKRIYAKTYGHRAFRLPICENKQ